MADAAASNAENLKALNEGAGQAAGVLSSLVSVVGPLALGIKLCADVFAGLTAKMAAQAQAAEAAAEKVRAAERAYAAAADKLQAKKASGASAESLKPFENRVEAAGEKLLTLRKKADEAAGASLGLGGVLSVAAGAVAAVVAGLSAAFDVTKQWAGALEPGLIQQFDQAMRNVQATLGQAFTGIFDQGINFLGKLAGFINPVMQQLKPVIDELTNTAIKNMTGSIRIAVTQFAALVPVLRTVALFAEYFGAQLRPVVAILGALVAVALAPLVIAFNILNAILSPVIKVLSAVFDGLTGIIETFTTIFQVVIDSINAALQSLFGGTVTDMVKGVKNAFAELRAAIVLAAARLALLFGATDFVKRLRDSLNPTGQQAAGPASIKSLEQIGKDLAQASVNAAGAGEAGEEDATAKLVGKLDAMLNDNKENTNAIVNAIKLLKLPGSETLAETGKFLDAPVGYVTSGVREKLGLESWNPFS
ncbi:hypothetical protein [Frigoriglobus tundricola]|uniref:hypothetical protein n=1 Tax=Frigoriglobus tundricola TaxID=2774151 RepID=UPI00148ECE5B|nr:hypothetical protein [Frigoriglobus tundricola]